MAFLFMLGAFLLGVAAGRFGGQKGWLVVPLLAVGLCVASLVTEGYVDPFVAVVAVLWGALAAIGVGIGLLLRRRGRPQPVQP